MRCPSAYLPRESSGSQGIAGCLHADAHRFRKGGAAIDDDLGTGEIAGFRRFARNAASSPTSAGSAKRRMEWPWPFPSAPTRDR